MEIAQTPICECFTQKLSSSQPVQKHRAIVCAMLASMADKRRAFHTDDVTPSDKLIPTDTWDNATHRIAAKSQATKPQVHLQNIVLA